MLLITSSIFGGTVGLLFLLVWVLLVIVALISILRKRGMYLGSKILWILVIVAVPIGGSLIYLSWGNAKQL